MRNLLILPICAIAISPILAKPVTLDKLHPRIKEKISTYCPESMDQEQIELISKGESVEIKGIAFSNENKKSKDFQENEGKLCSASLAQNRSAPTKIECGYCGEDKKAGLIVTARIDSEALKKYAEAEEAEKNMVAEQEKTQEIVDKHIKPTALKE